MKQTCLLFVPQINNSKMMLIDLEIDQTGSREVLSKSCQACGYEQKDESARSTVFPPKFDPRRIERGHIKVLYPQSLKLLPVSYS